ncbi:MAG: PD-(D/E)XK nuclease family transposase, partial [Methylococcales bacterium]|nr:PD-(D/E)XK nuclease family transposase [Methylococcales bacterium]
MYLASLNYDRFFKKVFSEKHIAQQFLEDFLDTKIEEIELLKEKHRVTDDASIVEFDFRCKIDGAYIIIDMQQWYKMDVVKRFYLYHSLNSSLQLERLPEKQLTLDRTSKKIKRTKDYHYVEPVLTLIWMVDDNLGFDENYVSYALSPEVSNQFIEDKKLWENPELTDIIKAQQKVLAVLKNDAKGMRFLSNNKLT